MVLDRDITAATASKAFQVDVSDREAVEEAVREAAVSLTASTRWSPRRESTAAANSVGVRRRLGKGHCRQSPRHGVHGQGGPALPEGIPRRVVTVASTLAKRALPEAKRYCASKFGVLGFTHALAAETAGEIGVTAMIPGGMKTKFFDDRPEQYKPSDDSRLNDPANVARAILFVLSQPVGCEVREMLICHEGENSWP